MSERKYFVILTLQMIHHGALLHGHIDISLLSEHKFNVHHLQTRDRAHATLFKIE